MAFFFFYLEIKDLHSLLVLSAVSHTLIHRTNLAWFFLAYFHHTLRKYMAKNTSGCFPGNTTHVSLKRLFFNVP